MKVKFSQQVLYFITIPVFFFLFTILYKPFNLDATLNLPGTSFAFNTAIISAILFVVLIITRLVIWGLGTATDLSKRTYYIWYALEIVICSLFVSLYVSLISRGVFLYIDVLPLALVYLVGILCYPYIILTIVLETDIIGRYAREESDLSRLRFHDDNHKLKLVTQASAVLYIESDENYCNIFYTEGGRIKKFSLRSTMKSLEDSCAKYGILRCHRKYFVNVRRIKVLRKEREGLNLAEMDIAGIDPIPVTLRYYDQISKGL